MRFYRPHGHEEAELALLQKGNVAKNGQKGGVGAHGHHPPLGDVHIHLRHHGPQQVTLFLFCGCRPHFGEILHGGRDFLQGLQLVFIGQAGQFALDAVQFLGVTFGVVFKIAAQVKFPQALFARQQLGALALDAFQFFVGAYLLAGFLQPVVGQVNGLDDFVNLGIHDVGVHAAALVRAIAFAEVGGYLAVILTGAGVLRAQLAATHIAAGAQ